MQTGQLPLANRVFLAARDIEDAYQFLSSLDGLLKIKADMKEEAYVAIEESLHSAAIIAYSRPFKKSRSYGNAVNELKPEELKLFQDKKILENLHNEIIALRDSVVAHSDWNFYNTTFYEGDSKKLPHRTFKRIKCRHKVDAKEFKDLVLHVLFSFNSLGMSLDLNR